MVGKERLFRFKQFAVAHGRSAMPVGFDGVLLGAWADLQGAADILDAGTGCGVIALQCAQRSPEARVSACDIHEPSVLEARENFAASPWADRLKAVLVDFNDLHREGRGFDLIISNPPFFHAGIGEVEQSARLRARHALAFGPMSLVEHGAELLSEEGSIVLVCEASAEADLLAAVRASGLYVRHLCRVISTRGDAPKRILLQASRIGADAEPETLHIYAPDGGFTEEYRALTAPFYLRF